MQFSVLLFLLGFQNLIDSFLTVHLYSLDLAVWGGAYYQINTLITL